MLASGAIAWAISTSRAISSVPAGYRRRQVGAASLIVLCQAGRSRKTPGGVVSREVAGKVGSATRLDDGDGLARPRPLDASERGLVDAVSRLKLLRAIAEDRGVVDGMARSNDRAGRVLDHHVGRVGGETSRARWWFAGPWSPSARVIDLVGRRRTQLLDRALIGHRCEKGHGILVNHLVEKRGRWTGQREDESRLEVFQGRK